MTDTERVTAPLSKTNEQWAREITNNYGDDDWGAHELVAAITDALDAAEKRGAETQLCRDMRVTCFWCRNDNYEPPVWERDGKYWHQPKHAGWLIEQCGAGSILDDDENADWHDHGHHYASRAAAPAAAGPEKE